MLRPVFLAAAGLALALPLHAQTPIRAGRTLRGALTASDPAGDASHYDLFAYRGLRGERATFTLRSGRFKAFLALGRMSGGKFREIDSGGGTYSRLTATLPSDGAFRRPRVQLRRGRDGRLHPGRHQRAAVSGSLASGNARADDGGADAKIEITLPLAGSCVIRANTVSAGETGAYTLTAVRR